MVREVSSGWVPSPSYRHRIDTRHSENSKHDLSSFDCKLACICPQRYGSIAAIKKNHTVAVWNAETSAANVRYWWLAAVPSAIVRTKFFERLSKESNALLRVALDPSIILKASQRVQKQRVIFAWLAIKIGLFRQHSTPRCSAAHALSKAWHSPSMSTIGRKLPVRFPTRSCQTRAKLPS